MTRSAALVLASALCLSLAARTAGAVEIRGQVDLHAAAADAGRSWTRDGLGKLRYDRHGDGLRLGQAFLRIDGELADAIDASVTLSAADDRHRAVNVNEAWIAWTPLPSGPWKTRLRAGAFFPPTSIEIDYDSIGWTPVKTISSAAINSWIGEELRAKGIELTVTHRDREGGSPHEFGFTAALYGGNDPAGTVIAWRGWSISDRITGLSEPLLLADLPVYRRTGPIFRQSRTIHLFRELDGRAGYWLGGHYGYGERVEAAYLYYDNRADPLRVKDGQYGWTTRFHHASVEWHPHGDWEVSLQALRGMTLMGRNAVRAEYASWFALVSHPFAGGTAALRYDRFHSGERDNLPSDPNTERGHGIALAWSRDLGHGLTFLAEALQVKSERAARVLVGEAPRQTERSVTAALRWQF